MSTRHAAGRRDGRRRRWLSATLLGLALAATPGLGQARTDGAAAPGWQALSNGQQQLLAPFAGQWDEWSAEERQAWLDLAARFPAMPPANQLRAREGIRQWAALTPEERRTARSNFRRARRLPEDQRIERWQRYRTLTPEQRAILREHGRTGNTAAQAADPATGLARDAARPLAEIAPPGPDGKTTRRSGRP